MPWFDIVLGIVPDYMHGVLMGVTKTLLSKWFSPSQSKQPFSLATIYEVFQKGSQASNLQTMLKDYQGT